MAVMSDSAVDAADAALDEVASLVPLLIGTLDTLAVIARGLHPPWLPELIGLIGDQDATLAEALERLRAAPPPPGPGTVRDQLGEAADLALSACAGLSEAAWSPAGPGAAFRALGQYTRAVEVIYPLSGVLPVISRWFLSPGQQDDADLIERLRQPPVPGTGVQHVANERGTRGGFSVYVPEYLDPATPAPVVVALHGGSGHGHSFLWTWIREARSRGLILATPTSTGSTWSLADPDVDITHLNRVLEHIRSGWTIDPERMLLTGMSDGGTFTLMSGVTEASPFTHLAPIAASFHPLLMMISDPARMAGLPIYLVHGDLDWMFPVELAHEAYAALSDAGARVDFREIPDLSHTYPAEENPLIIDWLQDR